MPNPSLHRRAAKMFSDTGAIINDDTREVVNKFLQAFVQWIEKNIAK